MQFRDKLRNASHDFVFTGELTLRFTRLLRKHSFHQQPLEVRINYLLDVRSAIRADLNLTNREIELATRVVDSFLTYLSKRELQK